MYTLMCKTKGLLTFSVLDDGSPINIRILDKTLLPESLKKSNGLSLYEWLRSRNLDTTRSNARLLLKLMKISSTGIFPVLHNRGMNLTDTYWIRHNENEKYTDFCLYRKKHNKYVVETSLSGAVHGLEKCINAELTNIGSFNKAWIKDEKTSKWLLNKKGDFRSFYAELFAYKLGKYLGMNMTHYQFNKNTQVIESVNFTNELKMLEHYATLKYMFTGSDFNDTDDLIIAKNMRKIGCLDDYLDMLLLDGLVSNVDRHEFNYGVLKSTKTGEILGLAPNFDNNLALGSGSEPTTYLLKEYLMNFGIQERQLRMLKKLNFNVIKQLDKQVKSELGMDENTDYVANHFKKVFEILSNIH